ncbi:MAG: hypothetical protein R3B07_27900 [Polyangiaceae bacterium]
MRDVGTALLHMFGHAAALLRLVVLHVNDVRDVGRIQGRLSNLDAAGWGAHTD